MNKNLKKLYIENKMKVEKRGLWAAQQSKVYKAMYPIKENGKREISYIQFISKSNKINRITKTLEYYKSLQQPKNDHKKKIKRINRRNVKINALSLNYLVKLQDQTKSGTNYKFYEFNYSSLDAREIIQTVSVCFKRVVQVEGKKKHYNAFIYYSEVEREDEMPIQKKFSVKWSSYESFIDNLKQTIKNISAQYETTVSCDSFSIGVSSNNIILGRGSNEQTIENYSDWTILGNKTRTNCIYQAFYISQFGGIPENITSVSKHLKSRLKPKNKTWSGYQEIQQIADVKKCDIILHSDDQKKSIIEIIKTNIKDVCKTEKKPDIHIMFDGKHYHGMFKGEAKIENEAFKNREKVKTHTEAGKIVKKFKENKYNNNFCSWDIEASLDDKNNFKAYAVGFFDGKDYKSWWGLDCLQLFEKFLYENRQQLNNKVLYAHNSGKFDVLLFMSEVILTSTLFEIDTTSTMGCLELNGRWLNITLITKDNHKIHFRDSCALLPGKLEDLTRDFNVKHKKLSETVDHNKITLQNWEEFKELTTYLEYDVLGLYEIVDQFSKDVWEATSFDVNSKEKFVKQTLEELSGQKWEKKRPQWMKTNEGKILELDCYNESLKMAVEYNGEQHYKPCKWNNFNIETQKSTDEKKVELCKKNNVKLLVIPFWKKKEEIINELKSFLKVDKEIEFEKLGKKQTGINITDCLTGASLSKKFFFSKYYDKDRLPVWTLDDETDKFIRSGYYGGRVEIFNFRRCKGNKFYYYDFTSLFPAMACKQLPYGKPERVTGEEIDINNFFGFIKCEVSTIRKNIKPLHAKIEKGKLLFKHVNKCEMVLFSEEIKLGMKNKQYEYKFLEGIKFNNGFVMKKMSNDVFKLKAKAKEDGKDALSLVWKIILNSSYGFWGLRTHDREAVKVYPLGKAPVKAFLEDGKLKDESDIGNYTLLRVLNDLEVTDFNVGIASAITSYARCELWNLINDIETAGGKVFMCDTDSVVCNIDINDYPKIKKRYQWDGNGDELGCIKNELNSDVLKKKKDLTKEEKEKIKNELNLYYDKAIFNGAKYYAMTSEQWGMEVAKCKGFKKEGKKLTFANFDKPLEQTTKQFVCGLSGYMNHEDPFKINVRTINKIIKPQYNKAQVKNDGSIEPFSE